MNPLSNFWWILLYPLLGAALIPFVRRGAGWIGSGAVLLSFLHALAAFSAPRGGVVQATLYEWLPGIPFAFQFDELSGMMALIITGVGFLIHVYSIGYMKHEDGYWRYFACLNLFVFFMLILVLANNLALLFAGWEGVGLASYLLIGFHHDRPTVNRCATKAFLYNRVGDAGFLLGIFILLGHAGSVEFSALASVSESPWILAAALLLALGATGKSAQLPLFVWLPDAMVGPTPVSALIHAATMVTGGIYLFARLGPLFAKVPEAGEVVAAIGIGTALLAATVALVENDIKRILAYSTVSQLGLMFLACGVGATGAAMFHVATHAFFKALLFLCAGNLIHGLHGEQDIRYMGGLKDRMPWTFRLMTVGALALAGFPGLAGFFSKDAILMNVEQRPVFLALGFLVSLLTAMYCGRMMWRVFFGAEGLHQAHEAQGTMLHSLWPLAAGAVVAGYFGPHEEGAVWILFASGIIAIAGLYAGRFVMVPQPLRTLFEHRWYLNELYEWVFVRGVGGAGARTLAWLDRHIVDLLPRGPGWTTAAVGWFGGWFDRFAVDGLVRLSGAFVVASSYPARLVQTGRAQNYVLIAVAVMVLLFGFRMWQSGGTL
jgi:NADH-quinone oxidoreductase subunit L